MFRSKWRIVLGAALVLALAPGLSGCGGGIAAQVLKVTAAAILPDRWTSGGGLITLLADVVGDGIVREVKAWIRKLGSDDVSEVVLTPNTEGQYEATFTAENGSEINPQDYAVTVTATDTIGNTATDSVQVEVPPTE